jgi:hypothetical protein
MNMERAERLLCILFSVWPYIYSYRTRNVPLRKPRSWDSYKHRLILASLPEEIVIGGAAFLPRLGNPHVAQIRLSTLDMTNHCQPPVVSGLWSPERQSSGISEMADQVDRVISLLSQIIARWHELWL